MYFKKYISFSLLQKHLQRILIKQLKKRFTFLWKRATILNVIKKINTKIIVNYIISFEIFKKIIQLFFCIITDKGIFEKFLYRILGYFIIIFGMEYKFLFHVYILMIFLQKQNIFLKGVVYLWKNSLNYYSQWLIIFIFLH